MNKLLSILKVSGPMIIFVLADFVVGFCIACFCAFYVNVEKGHFDQQVYKDVFDSY